MSRFCSEVRNGASCTASIPTVIFYNAFVNRVNHIIVRLETRVNGLVRLLGGDD